MLLIEWDRWWESIPILTSEESMAAYTIGVLADAGWKLDREDFLNVWRETISRGRALMQAHQENSEQSAADAFNQQPGALRAVARAVSSWLHQSLIGPGPKRGAVDWISNDASPPQGAVAREITTTTGLEEEHSRSRAV